MAILVHNETRLVVQGITGREGRFHTGRMVESGTSVVAGVTPGKGGQEYEGVPVFNTMEEAIEETGANASVIFVPAAFCADAIFEALDFDISTVCCITEGVPVHDMMRVTNYLRLKDATLIGPNCPGVLSPEKANVSIMPRDIFAPGVKPALTAGYALHHEACLVVHQYRHLLPSSVPCKLHGPLRRVEHRLLGMHVLRGVLRQYFASFLSVRPVEPDYDGEVYL